jgi:hypothetical protein
MSTPVSATAPGLFFQNPGVQNSPADGEVGGVVGGVDVVGGV